MNLHQQAIGPSGNRRPRERMHELTAAGRVAGIGEHG